MKKKVISIMLAGVMAASLGAMAGCGSTDSSSSSNSNSNASSASDETASGYSTEIDMDEDPYTVAIQVVLLPGVEVENEADIEAAINEITLPAINCEVDIQYEWISELNNDTSMAIAGNEKIDLVHVGTVQTLSTMVGSDMLLDMNEDNLLQNRGQDLVELFGEDLLESGYVSGKQLAIPAAVYSATKKGIYYNKTLADAANIEIPEEIDMDQLEEILYAVADAYPDVMPYYIGTGELNYLYWLEDYEVFGSEASYGVILDVENDTTVENLFATDLFKDYCLRMYQWRQDGILTKDTTDDTSAQTYYFAQQLFCVVGNVQPEQDVNFSSDDFEVGSAALTGASVSNSSITEYMWGIAANCERPDKAMDFLNFLYTNADVANLLMYGIEGVNYDFADGSDTVIVTNGSYDPMFYRGGDSSEMLIESPAEDDYIEKWDALTAEATVSPLCGYMFDDTDYQTESSVIYSAILEYMPTLQNGMYDSEDAVLAAIDEFNAKLEASGINDVIAANQEQIDAYLAEQ